MYMREQYIIKANQKSILKFFTTKKKPLPNTEKDLLFLSCSELKKKQLAAGKKKKIVPNKKITHFVVKISRNF